MSSHTNRRATLVALIIGVLLLANTGSAWAARKACGPGCASGPDELILNAADGDVLTPLYEQDFGRNTNGAVVTKNIEIEGGWSSPNFNCGGNSSGNFPDRDALIAAGLTYTATNLSELRGFGTRVIGLDAAVKSLKVRNIIFGQFGDFTGNGGGLGQSGAGLSGANIEINNALFRPDPSSNLSVTGNGGGLYLELDGGSVLRITNSTFSKHIATNGGAIQVRLRGNSKLIITGDSFQNNSVSGQGGAIRIILESGSVVITDSQFSGNSATVGGRDIRIEGPTGVSVAQSTKPAVYLLRNSYSGASSVLVSGAVDVFTQQTALPLIVR